MRLVIISDTHNEHNRINLPHGDVLIHCGDATNRGTLPEIRSFLGWFGSQPHSHKILVAGNHDFMFQKEPALSRFELMNTGITYLENESIIIDGVNFLGSPFTPIFGRWAFMQNEEGMGRLYSYFDACDVLLTHGPAHGTLDVTARGDLAGCKYLKGYIERERPIIHAFGHIHECGGMSLPSGRTLSINASAMDVSYKLKNLPMVVDLDKDSRSAKIVVGAV